MRVLDGSTHAIAVVFADEQHRQLPQLGQIERFVKLPFGHGAVTKEHDRHPFLAAHLVGQGHAHGHRQMPGDDGVATVEARVLVKEMHRSTTTAGAAFLLAVHLRHDRRCGHAAGQSLAVFAVGGDDIILRTQRFHKPHGYGLFADV